MHYANISCVVSSTTSSGSSNSNFPLSLSQHWQRWALTRLIPFSLNCILIWGLCGSGLALRLKFDLIKIATALLHESLWNRGQESMRAGWKRSGKTQTNVFGSLLIKTSLNLDLHQMSCSKWELRQRMWVRWRESEMHVQKRLKKSKHSINKLGKACAKRYPEYDMHYVSLKWKSISWNIYITGWHDQ